VSDAIIAHEGRQPADKLKKRVLELFSLVGLPPAFTIFTRTN